MRDLSTFGLEIVIPSDCHPQGRQDDSGHAVIARVNVLLLRMPRMIHVTKVGFLDGSTYN